MSQFADSISLRTLIHVALLRPFVKLVFGVNAVGADHLRDVNQYIIIANHNSHLDVLLLFTVIPARHINRTHPVAAREYFSRWKPLFRLVDYLFQPVWITRGKHARDPLEGMKERLAMGHNIVVFPEGTRGTPGEIGRFHTGIGRLAIAHPDVPIVPVFLFGPEKALPKTSSIPLPLWNEITIGPPQLYTQDRRDIALALENLIRELASATAANRHRRRKKPPPTLTIAVLGIDGSGKSTLSRAVAKRLGVGTSACLVSDSLEFYENGDLKRLQPLLSEKARGTIGNYAKKAESLKRYKIPKLAELLLRDHIMRETKRWYSPTFLVLDGCPLLNLAAWASLYKDQPFDANACGTAMRILSGRDDSVPRTDAVYEKFPEVAALGRLRLVSMQLPDVVILLDADPVVAVTRIERRGEKKQPHETEEKLAKLRASYRSVCDVVMTEFRTPTRILDGQADIETLTEIALSFIKEHRTKELVDE